MPGTSSDPPGCARLVWCLAPLCGYGGRRRNGGGGGGGGEICKNMKCKDRQCLVVFSCHFFVLFGGGGGGGGTTSKYSFHPAMCISCRALSIFFFFSSFFGGRGVRGQYLKR